MNILRYKPNLKKSGFQFPTGNIVGMKWVWLLPLSVLFSFFFSCQYQVPDFSLKGASQKTKDSVDYLMEHYYTLNSNFEVTSDSLLLQQLPLIDVLPVYKGEKLVVRMEVIYCLIALLPVRIHWQLLTLCLVRYAIWNMI